MFVFIANDLESSERLLRDVRTKFDEAVREGIISYPGFAGNGVSVSKAQKDG